MHPRAPHPNPNTTIGHYENFPVASWLCPAHLREPIAAIYHFARTADDIADEGEANPTERLMSLADYRAELVLAAGQGAAATPAFDPRWAPVFAALQRTLAVHPLPVSLFHDLLDAFVQDIEKTRDASGYANEAELLDYCRRSANPVGRLLLSLYGVTDAQSLEQSDAICTALQLINFWQDPSVDLPRGRSYFPQHLQDQFGIPAAELRDCRISPATTRMVAHCVQSARATMLRGAPLVHTVPGRAGWELRLVVQGGLRILDKIESLGFNTLQQRPTLKTHDYAVLLWRAVWM